MAFNRQRLGMQVNLPTMHMIAPTIKSYPASNVNRAKIENPWNRVMNISRTYLIFRLS